MAATIKDIGRLAGVSAATVSNVFNGNDSKVSPATKERILLIAKELHYRPNRLAKGLVSRNLMIIGLIIPNVTNPYLTEISRGVLNRFADKSYMVMTSTYDERAKDDCAAFQAMMEYNVSGIVVTGKSENFLRACESFDSFETKIVTVDNRKGCADYNVYADLYEGSYLAGQYLAARGHRNILYLSNSKADAIPIPGNPPFGGFAQALNDHGVHVDETNALCSCDETKLLKRLRECMSEGDNRPTVVVCNNTRTGLLTYQALNRLNMSVFNEVDILVLNDVPGDANKDPLLTSICHPAYEMGKCAADMLLSRIKNIPLTSLSDRFPPQLIERSSASDLIAFG